MKVEVLGPGCPKCKQLYENALEAAKGLADVEVVKVADMNRLMEVGAMMVPALVIDGKVKSSGKVLAVPEIRQHISS